MKRITAFFIMVLTAACAILIPPVTSKTVVPTIAAAIIPETPSPVLPAAEIPLEPETPASTKTITPAIAAVSSQTPMLTTGLPPLPTNTPNPTQAKQQDEIKRVIQAYFAIRYDAFSVSPSVDIQENMFGGLVSDGEEARNFLITEAAKLAVERKWYELNKYTYAAYKYSLKYNDIGIDTPSQTAEILLVEYFEITCQRTMENNPENPKACAIGNLTHKIILQIEQGEWKIISDVYRDSWWRQFRAPGLSVDEILHNISLEMQKLETIPTPTKEYRSGSWCGWQLHG
jgi:hypothetical protein